MLRILVSPTRSGSTAFLRCFENNPDVAKVYHQPVKSGYRERGEFDYGFFSLDSDDENLIFVAKETVGGFAPPETEFNPVSDIPSGVAVANRFPSPEMIEKVRPIFLFRDPLQTWNSINKLNEYSKGKSPFFSPFEYFIASYKNVFDFLLHAKGVTKHAHCLTLESLASQPYQIFQDICEKWKIKFYKQMIEWNLPYGENTQFSEETKHRMAHDPRFMKSKESLEASSRFEYAPSAIENVSLEEREQIKKELQPIYDKTVLMTQTDFPDCASA